MNTPPLQLVAEQGKDWGLSVVGTREQLLDLATSLKSAVEIQPEPSTLTGTVQILDVPVCSPYSDRPHFYFAYCLASSTSKAVTPTRSGPSAFIILSTGLLALVGLASIAQWVWHAL